MLNQITHFWSIRDKLSVHVLFELHVLLLIQLGLHYNYVNVSLALLMINKKMNFDIWPWLKVFYTIAKIKYLIIGPIKNVKELKNKVFLYFMYTYFDYMWLS